MESLRMAGRGMAGLAVCALSACSTLPRSGGLQVIELEAVTPMGVALEGAACTLDNGQANWTANAPGRVTVVAGAGALVVRCRTADGLQRGEVSVAARVAGGAGTRALGGGLMGGAAGGAVGLATYRTRGDGYNFSGVAAVGGAITGALLGAGLGAATGDSRHEYPERVRIVLQAQPVVLMPR